MPVPAPSRFQHPLLNWIDTRLPILTLLHHEYVEYPMPKNVNYLWAFGMIAGFVLVVLIATGLFLAMQYDPNGANAFNSVEHIMRDVNYGWLLRYVHANGAAFFFLAVYIHTFRGIYYGSYQSPRELVWLLGVVILLLMMATGFTGYVLPWGQMSFWAATVITNLFSAIPVVGDSVVSWLWGGFSVGDPTLNRFFAFHFLLPFVILGAVILHTSAFHITGSNNPLGIEIKGPQDSVPFTPYATVKDLFAVSVFFTIYFGFAFFLPNYMNHPDNAIPANPLLTPPHIVPEWYFLPLYAVLRAIPDKLGGVILMFAAVFVLFFLPWLDRSKVRSGVFRPYFRIAFWLLVADVILLGYCGARPPEGIWIPLCQVATAYYFFHFLVVLPFILPKYEKYEPLPESISAYVLAKKGGAKALATEKK